MLSYMRCYSSKTNTLMSKQQYQCKFKTIEDKNFYENKLGGV